jgi:hypothetical protein
LKAANYIGSKDVPGAIGVASSGLPRRLCYTLLLKTRTILIIITSIEPDSFVRQPLWETQDANISRPVAILPREEAFPGFFGVLPLGRVDAHRRFAVRDLDGLAVTVFPMYVGVFPGALRLDFFCIEPARETPWQSRSTVAIDEAAQLVGTGRVAEFA